MKVDLRKIKEFYKTDLGQYAHIQIENALSIALQSSINDSLCITSHGGYFYEDVLRRYFSTLARHTPDDERDDVHALCWPTTSNTADCVVMVHDIEFSKLPDNHIAEAWRVLKDNGKLIVIFPNRAGQWAQYDTTPFGFGTPQSQKQMHSLLKSKRFDVIESAGVLYYPPTKPRLNFMRNTIDRTSGLCGFFKSGVIMICAQKILNKGSAVKPLSEKAEDVVRGALSPKPSPTPKATLDSRSQ